MPTGGTKFSSGAKCYVRLRRVSTQALNLCKNKCQTPCASAKFMQIRLLSQLAPASIYDLFFVKAKEGRSVLVIIRGGIIGFQRLPVFTSPVPGSFEPPLRV